MRNRLKSCLVAASLGLGLGLGLVSSALAQTPEPTSPASEASAAPASPAEEEARIKAIIDGFMSQMHPRTGDIEIASGKVTLHVPETFYYLDPADSRRVLSEVWGNAPQDSDSLGMLFPAGATPFDDDAWGVVIDYEDTGHISDADAGEINYSELMEAMKQGAKDEAPARKAQNLPSIEIVGWAKQPRYDAATHKMYWAKELVFDGASEHTLNYDMRTLGRLGVLSFNFVAPIGALAKIETASADVLKIPSFNAGWRYEDFDAANDKMSDLGLAGLVAGGAAGAALLAKKAGILGIALVLLKKFGVFLVVGLVAAGGWVMRMLGLKKADSKPQPGDRKVDTSFFDGPAKSDAPPQDQPQPPTS